MTNPRQDLTEILDQSQDLILRKINIVLGKWGHGPMSDREVDSLNRTWMEFRAQAVAVLRGRMSDGK